MCVNCSRIYNGPLIISQQETAFLQGIAKTAKVYKISGCVFATETYYADVAYMVGWKRQLLAGISSMGHYDSCTNLYISL